LPEALEATIRFTINGEIKSLTAHPLTRLLDIVRDLGLTGTKEGCGEGECGACAVLLNGEVVNSCLIPILQVQGRTITTIEGLASNSTARHLQEAFVACGGAQCGICTPGMIVAACSLLERNPHPSDDALRDGLAGNLCRCTGYTRIFEAVRVAQTKLGKVAAR
jgi:aerobic carbon-monoxide dehydrogenase small subunit